MYRTRGLFDTIRGHKDRMDFLQVQNDLAKYLTGDEKVSAAVLVKNITNTSNIPIRAAINAPEAYGGIRDTEISGYGTVVCHSDQITAVRKEVDRAQTWMIAQVLEDILGLEDAKKYNVNDMTPIEKQKFLEQYGQPLAPQGKVTGFGTAGSHRLRIPATRAMKDGHPAFETDGRVPFWPEDIQFDQALGMTCG